WSWRRFLLYPSGQVAKTSAQYPRLVISQAHASKGGREKPCAQTDGDNSRLARRKKRESTRTGSKVYCESGETSKKLSTHSKRKNYAPGVQSERLTRLFGAGAPFRPLFRPIPSNLFRDRRIPIHASHPTTQNRMAATARGKYP